MKKRILPQSKPVNVVNATPTAVATHFLAIPERIQRRELPNILGFYVSKMNKTTEKFTIDKKIFFAKINKALHQFLETQNTNNQNNNHTLDIGYINTTAV